MSLVVDFLEFVETDAPDSVGALLDRFLLKCRLTAGADCGAIYMVRRRGGQRVLDRQAHHGGTLLPRAADPLILPLSPMTVPGHVAVQGIAIAYDDPATLPADRPFQAWAARQSGALLCFPVTNFQGQVIAVVELCRAPAAGPFPADMLPTLLPVARVVSGYIERTDNLEQIQAKNVKLRQRNRTLANQRSRIGELQSETEEAFKLSIGLLARAAEIHDEGTGNHCQRVNEYAHFLASLVGMPKDFCDAIRYSAQLHDVGKMSVDAAILHKGGQLTANEKAVMDKHPVYGYQILSHSPRLQLAAEIALFHHEKWDGSGYPHGVRGDAIPMSARVVAIADTYDALRSHRSYKPGYSHEKSVDIIVNGDDRLDARGHFDPQLIALFAKHHAGFDRIWREFLD